MRRNDVGGLDDLLVRTAVRCNTAADDGLLSMLAQNFTSLSLCHSQSAQLTAGQNKSDGQMIRWQNGSDYKSLDSPIHVTLDRQFSTWQITATRRQVPGSILRIFFGLHNTRLPSLPSRSLPLRPLPSRPLPSRPLLSHPLLSPRLRSPPLRSRLP